MKDREKILDQLRKLNAMAESAADIGNEEDAQAFAAKVQELLTAYKLIFGFITRLQERFEEEIRPKEPTAQTTAIIHVRANSLSRVQDFVKDNIETKDVRMATGDGGNRDGRNAGRAYADNLNLQPRGIEGTGKNAPRIRG